MILGSSSGNTHGPDSEFIKLLYIWSSTNEDSVEETIIRDLKDKTNLFHY